MAKSSNTGGKSWTLRLDAPHSAILAIASAWSIADVVLRSTRIISGVTLHEHVVWLLRTSLTNASQDLILIWSCASLFIVLAYASKGSRAGYTAVVAAFALIAIVNLILGCINFVAIDMIGGPLTIQWIYYADLFRSFTSQSAIRPALNQKFFLSIALALGVFIVAWTVLVRLLAWVEGKRIRWLVPIAFAVVLGGYFARLHDKAFKEDPENLIVNPMFELVRSAAAAPAADLLANANAVRPVELPPARTTSASLPPELRQQGIRNVLLLVLESGGAKYVAGTGPARAERWTPRLASYRPSTLVFRNMYAHVPQSTKSLFSLLTSRYPLFSYEGETARFRQTPFVTLSSKLKQAGFRTAFFMSGDFAFQSVDEFLQGRGFDVLADIEDIRCSRRRNVGSSSEWRNLDAVDDHCSAQALIRWIDRDRAKPFFGIWWSGNTHWPYFPSPEPSPGEFAGDSTLNRYLAALHGSDDAIGKMLDHLRKTGLLDSTVVLVMGDHGEAFGEHVFRAHNNTIYEEETHIPFLLINGKIRGPRQSEELGGMIDVAPTVLHLLQKPPERSWEGRSLFEAVRPSEIFMFAPNRDMTAGYRKGVHKYVLRTARGDVQVFNLVQDPGETRNLATPAAREEVRNKISGWLQAQRQLFSELE